MKRIVLGLVLALALVFTIGSAAMAAPITVGEGGSFFLFGEYAPLEFVAPFNVFMVGAGYTISDGFAIGVEAQTYLGTFIYGGFAVLSFDPLAASVEFFYDGIGYLAKATGLFLFDLGGFKLGAGGGMFLSSFTPSLFFVEGAAAIAVDSFSIYGAVDYWVDGWTSFKAGVSIGF